VSSRSERREVSKNLKMARYYYEHPLTVLLGSDDHYFSLLEAHEGGATHEGVEFFVGERREKVHPREAALYLSHGQIAAHSTVGSHS
jgi:hypothetical protein